MAASTHIRRAARGAAAALCLTAASSAAGARWALLGGGSCHDGELLRAFAQALQAQGLGSPLDVPPLGPPSPRAEDVERQLQEARQLFYDGRYAQALRRLDEVLEQARRLRPGSERWRLFARGLVYRGNTLRHQGRIREASDALAALLRVDPRYTLDVSQFAPSTREFFAGVRDQVASERAVRLTVLSTPEGAQVYLDGRPAGQTPFQAELAPTRYEVQVERDGLLSLPHRVELRAAASLEVDLPSESAVRAGPPFCVEGGTAGQARRLGGLVGAEQVVLARWRSAPGGGPPVLSATLFSSSKEEPVREGWVAVPPGMGSRSALADLATFLVTGQAGSVQASLRSPAGSAVSVGPLPALAQPASAPLAVTAHARVELGVGGAAAASAATGVGLQVASWVTWQRFNSAFAAAGPGPADAAHLAALQSAARTEQQVAIAAFAAAGALAAVDAAFLWVWRGEGGAGALIGPWLGSQGAGVGVSGRLP